jgi:CIC family chloride channel protein
MSTDPTIIRQGASFAQVREQVLGSRHHVFPVVDGDERFRGVITLDALRPFLFEEGLEGVVIATDLAVECPEALGPDDDLQSARESFVQSVLDELPVVEPESGAVIGILREHALHAAYNRAVSRIE